MSQDLRHSAHFKAASSLYAQLHRVGSGLVTDGKDVDASRDGSRAVFAGKTVERLEGLPASRICIADIKSGAVQVLTFGPNTDRAPKFSPCGGQIAFLSDRGRAGDFQLYLLDLETGAAQAAARVEGWVEYLHWSPDGTRILLGVAGHGADISGGEGAAASAKTAAADAPSWQPSVETGDETYRWRAAWIYNVAEDDAKKVSPYGVNIWEAVWCGDDAFVAVASKGPGEETWYNATLTHFDVATGAARDLYQPKDQLGWPSASPDGRRLAVVEAVSSDRWVIAGELLTIDVASGQVTRIATNNVDVTSTQWRSNTQVCLAGHRSFETVVLEYDADAGAVEEVWASDEIGVGGFFVYAAPYGEGAGDCVFIGEGFLHPPAISVIQGGAYKAAASLGHGAETIVRERIGAIEQMRWESPDGLEIEGWLLRPAKGRAPYPVIMGVHGGPVWHWQNSWLGRWAHHLANLLLLELGFALFLPNPRGSSGRGVAFARKVKGDICGADTSDFLSGLDHLIAIDVADPQRIGVTGISYGGCMTSWLVTQDQRFAAAVPIAPITDMRGQHLTSNIPAFDTLFLGDCYNNPGGKYFDRSAVIHAHKVTTPTLNIAGALDKCTPPTQAQEFHNALLEHGVLSELVIYPEEGHGVRKTPAMFDFAARVTRWFETHMNLKESP